MLGCAPAIVLALWLAVHRVPGFGPLVADALRAVFGKEFVAWLEDTAYGVQDFVNRKLRRERPTEPAWDVDEGMAPQAPAPQASVPSPAASSSVGGEPGAPSAPAFTRTNVAPMLPAIAAKGEGVWVPMIDVRKPELPARMLKTFLHPDEHRSWAVIAVVAVDLEHVELRLMAGRYEPESRTPESKSYARPAVVPEADRPSLLAAFNGGYKTTHGDYGMKLDGVTLVVPRGRACAVGKLVGGGYAIRSWEALREREGELAWVRQTPLCMYEEGKANPALEMSKLGWGASSVSGTTVIRRSAIGLDATGKVLFVGVGDFLTGKTLAHAMHHAGSADVAQLDVNFSFPKFVTYDANLKAIPLTKNFEFEEDQYVGRRAERDFFYLVHK